MNSERKIALFQKGLEQGAEIMVGGPEGGHMSLPTLDDFLAWAEDETAYWIRV